MQRATSQIRIGISGWRYAGWRGTFYPDDLVQRQELDYASRRMNSIEINGSFYSLQRPESYQRWFAQTPEDFVFAIKGGRYITHMRKLRGIDAALANFMASGILALNQKLGPILWQFPATMQFDAERFEAFFAQLPQDTQQAARIARGHEPWLRRRAWLRIDHNRPMRHAVEFRHASFLCESFVHLCRRYNVAVVFADSAGIWPYAEDVTADLIYIRLHGAEKLYTSGYTDEKLAWWAARIERWASGGAPDDGPRVIAGKPKRRTRRAVYVYFDNDVKVQAPFDAMRLAQRLGIGPGADVPTPARRGRRPAHAARSRSSSVPSKAQPIVREPS